MKRFFDQWEYNYFSCELFLNINFGLVVSLIIAPHNLIFESGLTTSLTIYEFGLPGNNVAKSIRKHRFRTEKPEKAHQIMQKIGIGAFGTKGEFP